MRNILSISFLLLVLCAGNAFAKGDGPCKADAERLCAGIEPGDGRIAKCLKEKESELSPACKAKKEEMKAAMKDVKEACHDDAEKFCEDSKPGKGRIMKCLVKHKDELSATCKDEMMKMKDRRHKKGA